MRAIELRVKAASLAAEARIIRHYEWRVLRGSARHAAWVAKQIAISGMTPEQMKGIEPPGIARTLELTGEFDRLRKHRLFELRPHARSTHLARTFLNGDPYKKAELYAMTRPDFEAVFSIVKRFSARDGAQLTAQAFERWKQDADAWHKSKEATSGYMERVQAARAKRFTALVEARLRRQKA